MQNERYFVEVTDSLKSTLVHKVNHPLFRIFSFVCTSKLTFHAGKLTRCRHPKGLGQDRENSLERAPLIQSNLLKTNEDLKSRNFTDSYMVGETNLPPTMQTCVNFLKFAEL